MGSSDGWPSTEGSVMGIPSRTSIVPRLFIEMGESTGRVASMVKDELRLRVAGEGRRQGGSGRSVGPDGKVGGWLTSQWGRRECVYQGRVYRRSRRATRQRAHERDHDMRQGHREVVIDKGMTHEV